MFTLRVVLGAPFEPGERLLQFPNAKSALLAFQSLRPGRGGVVSREWVGEVPVAPLPS